MRAAKDARRYAVLCALRPAADQRWRTHDGDALAMTDQAFEHHVAALCATAQDVRATSARHAGARSVERIKERVAAREERWTRRTALDLQRLADLEDRISLRHAEAARRRWFVLGRLLDRAVEEDTAWAQALEALIALAPLTALEAKALGRTPKQRRTRQ